MSLKEPDYTDEQGHVVHEGWHDGNLVFVEKSTLGDDKDHGYFERINYDADGKKMFRQLRTPTVFGFTTIEEHYDKGFLTSQREEVEGKKGIVVKIRQFYPQITPDGTRLDKEILRRETIINRTTGEIQEKEFALTGEEMVPEPKKKTPLVNLWKNKDR